MLARCEHEVEAVECRRPPTGVGERTLSPARSRVGRRWSGGRARAVGRAVRRSAVGSGEVQDVEDSLGRCLTLGAGVELCPGPAQGKEHLGGDQQHGQRGGERRPCRRGGAGRAPWPPARCRSRPGTPWPAPTGRPPAGSPSWSGAGPRSPRPPLGVPGAARPKARRVGSPATSSRKRAESDESRRHCRWVRLGRLPAEDDHGHRHQRDQAQQDEGREPVGARPPRPRCRSEPARPARRLGQVATEVGVEGGDAPGGGERELAGPLAGQPGRAEVEGLAEELAPQGRGDGGRGAVGGGLARPRPGRPGRRRRRPARAVGVHGAEGDAVLERTRSTTEASSTAWTTTATVEARPTATATTRYRRVTAAPGRRAGGRSGHRDAAWRLGRTSRPRYPGAAAVKAGARARLEGDGRRR